MQLSEDRSILGVSQTAVLVGAVIRVDDRYLLVREAKAICRGKWSVPGGHLKPGESIPDGAIREVKEETGHDIRLIGLHPLINCVSPYGTLILIPFAAEILETTGIHTQPDPDEILETGYFTRAEIEAMRDELRFPELITDLLGQVEQHRVLPLDILKIYR